MGFYQGGVSLFLAVADDAQRVLDGLCGGRFVGADAIGANASADVPRPTGSALIPLQHSPQWQRLAVVVVRNDLTPFDL